MKIVLLGKNGQLGWEMQNSLLTLGEVIALGRNELDISNIPALQNLLQEIKPDLIINTSAYTQVDLAETNSELAYQINAIAPPAMAETARQLGSVFIHYSTDYIFDGMSETPYKESDLTNPLNLYGKSKLRGEDNVQRVGDAYLIFRTSWVYSMRKNSFVNKVLDWAHKSDTVNIVNDQISNPTWARALADVTCQMLSQYKESLFENIKERHGIYHLAGSGYVSRFEWAKKILENASNRTDQLARTILPVPTDSFPTPVKRPLFTALDCTKFENVFGLRLPSWDDSLQTAMSE